MDGIDVLCKLIFEMEEAEVSDFNRNNDAYVYSK